LGFDVRGQVAVDELNDQIYLAVGRAVLDFAPLELVVHRVAWAGLDPLDDTAGRKLTGRMQLSNVFMLIEKYMSAGAYERYEPEANDRVAAFVSGCKNVAEQRGRLAHSYLHMGHLGQLREALAKRLPMAAFIKPIDLEAVRALPDEFYRLRDEGVEIAQRIEQSARTQ